MNTASDDATWSPTGGHRPKPGFACRQRWATGARATVTEAQPEGLGVAGRHGLIGLTGLSLIECRVLVAAPGTSKDRNTGQGTDQTGEEVAHSAFPRRHSAHRPTLMDSGDVSAIWHWRHRPSGRDLSVTSVTSVSAVSSVTGVTAESGGEVAAGR